MPGKCSPGAILSAMSARRPGYGGSSGDGSSVDAAPGPAGSRRRSTRPYSPPSASTPTPTASAPSTPAPSTRAAARTARTYAKPWLTNANSQSHAVAAASASASAVAAVVAAAGIPLSSSGSVGFGSLSCSTSSSPRPPLRGYRPRSASPPSNTWQAGGGLATGGPTMSFSGNTAAIPIRGGGGGRPPPDGAAAKTSPSGSRGSSVSVPPDTVGSAGVSLATAAALATSRTSSSTSLHERSYKTLPRTGSAASLQERVCSALPSAGLVPSADDPFSIAAVPKEPGAGAAAVAAAAESAVAATSRMTASSPRQPKAKDVGYGSSGRRQGDPLQGSRRRAAQPSLPEEASLHSASCLVACEAQASSPLLEEFALDGCKEIAFHQPQRSRAMDAYCDHLRGSAGDPNWGLVPAMPVLPAMAAPVPVPGMSAMQTLQPNSSPKPPVVELDFVGRTSRSSSSSSLQKIMEESHTSGACADPDDDCDGQEPDSLSFDRILASTELESKIDSPRGASTPGALLDSSPPHRFLAVASGGTGECASTGSATAYAEATPTKTLNSSDSQGLLDFGTPKQTETPRMAARRRKQEAADREAERLCEIARSNSRPQLCTPKESEAANESVEATLAWEPCEPRESLREAAMQRKREAADQEAERLCKVVQKAGRAQPCIPRDSGELFPAWEEDAVRKSSQENARRRKCEAADRHLEQLKQTHAGAAATAREMASRVKDTHTRSFCPPFATMDESAKSPAKEPAVAIRLSAPPLTPTTLRSPKSEKRSTELPGCSRFVSFKDSGMVAELRAN